MLMIENAMPAFLMVTLAYPALTLLLTEAQRSLYQKDSRYVSAIRQIQTLVLPCFAVYLVLTQIAGIDPHLGREAMDIEEKTSAGSLLARFLITGAAIFSVNTLLSILNAFLTSGRGRHAFLANIPSLLLDLIRLGLVLVGAAMIISYIWGVNLQGALVGLGVGGIVLGLALQDTLSALFAGLSMISTRNFKEGDWLKTDEFDGKVIGMDWRSVTVRTEQDILVVIPNSQLARTPFIVESTDKMPYGEEVMLKFSYDDPPEKVIDVIDQVARTVPDILQSPVHRIELLYFQDNGAEYELTFFVNERGQAWKARSDFLRRFWYAAERANLHPAGAHHMLYRVADDRKNPTHDRLAAMEAAKVFNPSSAGFDQLLSAASIFRFGRNETLMREGDSVNRLLIPFAGTLAVIDPQTGVKFRELKIGQFFVSRAFLLAGKSSVRICSETQCSVLEIPQQALLEFLDRNPHEAEQFEARIALAEERLASRGLSMAHILHHRTG